MFPFTLEQNKNKSEIEFLHLSNKCKLSVNFLVMKKVVVRSKKNSLNLFPSRLSDYVDDQVHHKQCKFHYLAKK